MVQRVVVNSIVHGDEDGNRMELKPGDVVDTDDLDMDEDEVAALDATGVFRARRDTASPVQATERRSGAVRDARDPRSLQDKPRRGRPRRTDSDEL